MWPKTFTLLAKARKKPCRCRIQVGFFQPYFFCVGRKVGLIVGVKSVTGLVFQNSNSLISCGAGDGIIKIWDLRKHYTVQKRKSLPKHVIPFSGASAKNGYSSLTIDSSGWFVSG